MAGGRPPILKPCARCLQPKPRRAYVNAAAEVCIECRRAIRAMGGPSGVQATDLAYTGHLGPNAPPPHLSMDPKVKDPIMDMIKLDAMTEAITKLFKPMPRCSCCYENRHVALDGYGGVALVCKRCEYQILATGACHLHHSKLYYPELTKPGPVPSPPEIEALFYVAESEKPKYDPAEIADADV